MYIGIASSEASANAQSKADRSKLSKSTFEGKQDSWKWGNTKWHKRELYGTKEADIEAWRKMKEWSGLKE
ncbi:hypothetical protein LPJ67_003063 [Coemansia sp. RSA 1938]|nr:hypothetical protein LPJ67_003063 [Coemansia sp. RSA 1938]